MKVGGWKTESLFRRYDIIDEADLTDAANRLDQKAAQLEKQFGQNLGIIAGNSTKNDAAAKNRLAVAVLSN